MLFKTDIGLQLSALCLQEFYDMYDADGTGIITNHISGNLLYDLLEWSGNDLTIDAEIKKQIWEYTKSDYVIIQDKNIKDADKHKELLKKLYKVKLLEFWLNKNADDNKRVLPSEIPTLKKNAHYYKFRMLREE